MAVWVKIRSFSFRNMHLKMLSAKWQLFCSGLNVLANKTQCVNKQSQWHNLSITGVSMLWMSQQTHYQTAFFIYEYCSRLTCDAGVQNLDIFDCPITWIHTLPVDVIHDTESGFVTYRELVSNGKITLRVHIGQIRRTYHAVWLWATKIGIRDDNGTGSAIQNSCSW